VRTAGEEGSLETPGGGQDLYRAWPDLLRLPAGDGAEIVYVLPARTAHVVTPERVRLLLGCTGFATLDQHAARVASQGSRGSPGMDLRSARAELGALAGAGLLASASDLLRRLGEGAGADAPARVTRLAIPTRERVPELRRALASYAENALAHGRGMEIVVGDDASTPEARARTRAAVAELGARYPFRIAYAGLEEKTRYAAALAAHAGVPRPVVEHALLASEGCTNTTGANGNTLILHCAGALMAHVDDDTRCRVAPVPGQLPGLALTSRTDLTELWFPAPGAPDLPDRVLVDRDYFALHEALLGRSVSACAADARQSGLDLDRASGALFRRLEARGGHVACTLTGAAGDSGTGSMWHYLLLGERSRERLLVSEAVYRYAFTGRRVVRAAPRATASDGSFCMGMSLGLDARTLLPPFFPVQRNCDGVFGVTLRACFRDAFFGYLPWVIEHAPPEPRVASFEAFFASLGQVATGDLVCLLVAASRVEADRTDPARSLRALGEALERWGSLPLPDFEEIVRVQVLRARSMDLTMLDDALGRHGRAPAYWARDVERAADTLRATLSRRSIGYPDDLVEAFGEERAREAFQRLVKRHGELLRAWPDLFEAAIELGRQDVRPGVVA
jgi:hypothetical protein